MSRPSNIPRTVLVTGGAGFVGSHLVERLIGQGVRVRVLDDLSMGRRENLPPEAELHVGDVGDPAAVDSALAGMQAVAHLAARVSVRRSVEEMSDDARVNILGSIAMLEGAARAGIDRFVLASSMAVYDEQPARQPIDERHPTRPLAPYGAGKLAAEHYLRLWAAQNPARCGVALRLFNTYGPRQTPTPYVGVITIFIRRLLAGEACTIFGDGHQTRDFIHVADVAKAFVCALGTQTGYTCCNIGTGVPRNLIELEALLRSHFPAAPEPRFGDARGEELRYSVADTAHAQTALNWRAEQRLDDRIEELIDWWRQATNPPRS